MNISIKRDQPGQITFATMILHVPYLHINAVGMKCVVVKSKIHSHVRKSMGDENAGPHTIVQELLGDSQWVFDKSGQHLASPIPPKQYTKTLKDFVVEPWYGTITVEK